ncbi:MAG: multifunctional CCA tRNA nucleotidyl transferase/2'3'-cyclic phosphodiesterase/2'nucleotidase/phosphatase [Pseudomonadota bacterium]
MNIYLVGGAVRDKLLGKPIRERDWVVVGSTPEEMTALGYKPVGKHFPVFLHPKTHEEYALARTERKVGRGYGGFTFYTGVDVTLEQDLKRRDLTINAIAEDNQQRLIDPYGGQADLQNKQLRHVSDAFVEDPVRLLRICRMTATLADFTVAPETLHLLKMMVENKEVDALVAERIWKELEKSLVENAPWRFFITLSDCNALSIILPDFQLQQGVAALRQAVAMSRDSQVRFAAAFAHITAEQLKTLCKKLRLPKQYTALSLLISRFYTQIKAISVEDSNTILDLLYKLDSFRRPERFEQVLITCEAIDQSQQPDMVFMPANIFRQALQACQHVNINDIIDESGKDIGQRIYQRRLEVIQKTALGDDIKVKWDC